MLQLSNTQNVSKTITQAQLESIQTDIERYWGEETEIMFPTSQGQIRRLRSKNTKKEILYAVSNLSNNKKVTAKWQVFNPETSYSKSPNNLYLVVKNETLNWLLDEESPLTSICGRIAKSINGSFYVHFEKYEMTFIDGGTGGGDTGAVGFKIPKGA